jgi:hypothetical protein
MREKCLLRQILSFRRIPDHAQAKTVRAFAVRLVEYLKAVVLPLLACAMASASVRPLPAMFSHALDSPPGAEVSFANAGANSNAGNEIWRAFQSARGVCLILGDLTGQYQRYEQSDCGTKLSRKRRRRPERGACVKAFLRVSLGDRNRVWLASSVHYCLTLTDAAYCYF